MLPCLPLQIMETQSEPFLDISEELAHVREAQTWVKGPPEHLWAAISACKGDLDTAGGLLACQHCAAWVHPALMLLRVAYWLGPIGLMGASCMLVSLWAMSPALCLTPRTDAASCGHTHGVTRLVQASQRLSSLSKWLMLDKLCLCCQSCGHLAP